MSRPQTVKSELISSAATYGAVLFVGLGLIYRVAKGHWSSVAFMAVIAPFASTADHPQLQTAVLVAGASM